MPKDYSSYRSLFQRGFVCSPQALDLQPLTCKFQSVGSLPKTSKTHCQTTKPTRLLLNQFSDSNFITYLLWAFSISLGVSLESYQNGALSHLKKGKKSLCHGRFVAQKVQKVPLKLLQCSDFTCSRSVWYSKHTVIFRGTCETAAGVRDEFPVLFMAFLVGSSPTAFLTTCFQKL